MRHKRRLNNLPELAGFRRKLRNALTPAEARLWTLLKRAALGRKFRRQHSVGRYILDFYCPSEKLAVELDGEDHFMPWGITYDNKESGTSIVLESRSFGSRMKTSSAWRNGS